MEMTGGQALVRSLKVEGVEVIFGLPGVQLDWAYDALYEERDHIRLIHTRHEQATGYMADGYARTTGRVGSCFVVPGPGLLNTTAALSTAYACSSPVLCLSGQIQSDLIGKGRGVLHEIPYQLEMLRSVTKWAGRAMTPQEIPGLVHRAFRQLGTGRPRPVEIEMPPDVLQATADVRLGEPEPFTRGPAGDSNLLEQAAQALGRAQRPLICSGGGVLLAEAWEELRRLAELLQAPVIMTRNGRGAISDRSYLAQTTLGGRNLLPVADVILAVGTRFDEPTTRWGIDAQQTVIQLDIDPEEIGRNYPPAISIQADAKLGLAALAQRAERHNRRRPSREEELTAVKKEARERIESVQPQAGFGLAIREELPDDAIVVSGMTQVGYWSHQGFPVYEPRTYVTSGYQGTLGYAFPTSLGAKVGNPEKKVVSINGDGGFMYNVQELSTMAQQGIAAVAIVFNDNAYGNVRRTQRQQFNGHIIGSDLLNPDLSKVADLFGVNGMRATSADQLRRCLREALASNQPALIEVPVEEMPSPWQLVRPDPERRSS